MWVCLWYASWWHTQQLSHFIRSLYDVNHCSNIIQSSRFQSFASDRFLAREWILYLCTGEWILLYSYVCYKKIDLGQIAQLKSSYILRKLILRKIKKMRNRANCFGYWRFRVPRFLLHPELKTDTWHVDTSRRHVPVSASIPTPFSQGTDL